MASGIQWFCTAAAVGEPSTLATMDADLTHPPALIRTMLAAMFPDGTARCCEIVIASRYARGGSEHGLSPLRLFYSRLASRVLAMLAPIENVRDYTCGFRLYDGEMLQRALAHYQGRLITEQGFVCMAELLIKLARRGARCREIGLELHYELKQGPSKLNVPATIMRYALLAWKLLFTRQFR
jgi:dolichol-phosphate mannosyltransferase